MPGGDRIGAREWAAGNHQIGLGIANEAGQHANAEPGLHRRQLSRYALDYIANQIN